MSTQLNLLERISAITGELAVYKESGILALVRLEKITIEPDLLSFTLKPQRGRSFGLESLRAFTVDSCFGYLDHSDGRYTSSIVSWVLETDPLKVIYLNNLINQKVSIDELLSAFRKRHGFYDDDTTKVVKSLMKLKAHLKSRKIILASNPEFKGQSWGGAGVMVISNDEGTKKQYAHFDGLTVISDQASQIGDLFRRIRRITATSPKYGYLSKFEFWSDLALAANSVRKEHSVAMIEETCDRVIMKAINFLTQELNAH